MKAGLPDKIIKTIESGIENLKSFAWRIGIRGIVILSMCTPLIIVSLKGLNS